MATVFQPGEIVDRKYRIERLLGSGGIGEVYLAHEDFTDRRVAIKVLRVKRSKDKGLQERMRREAMAGVRIRHRNIVEVLGGGATDDGALVYVVMEFIEGETLREVLIRGGALDLLTGVTIILQIAEAVAAMHKATIVHRDMKPENVIIREGGHVTVIDFGLAKLTDHVRRTTMAPAGPQMGTPTYMAPEQIENGKAVAKSDVYSLIQMLYEVLVGKHHWQVITEEMPDRELLQYKTLVETPPRLETQVEGVPPELGQLVADGFEKDPEKRPSAEDVVRRLRDVLRILKTHPSHGVQSQMNRQPASGAATPDTVKDAPPTLGVPAMGAPQTLGSASPPTLGSASPPTLGSASPPTLGSASPPTLGSASPRTIVSPVGSPAGSPLPRPASVPPPSQQLSARGGTQIMISPEPAPADTAGAPKPFRSPPRTEKMTPVHAALLTGLEQAEGGVHPTEQFDPHDLARANALRFAHTVAPPESGPRTPTGTKKMVSGIDTPSGTRRMSSGIDTPNGVEPVRFDETVEMRAPRKWPLAVGIGIACAVLLTPLMYVAKRYRGDGSSATAASATVAAGAAPTAAESVTAEPEHPAAPAATSSDPTAPPSASTSAGPPASPAPTVSVSAVPSITPPKPKSGSDRLFD